jgi:glycerophosphoryl diester phosphodiesterase
MSNASENLPKVIAHRGECLEMPENTPMAFSLAKERKLAGFECDIYMSADNKLICTHDRNLKRNFGLDKDTTQASYAEIKDIDVIALGKSWPGVKIPLIEDVLDLAEDGFEIWVELAGPKDHDAIGDASIVPHVKRAVENHPKATPERVLFISFDAGIVKAVKEQMPGYRAYWIKGVRWNSADNAPSISAAA